MLTSSDAKWRCMWHMLVWSILLTLVSQFLIITDHVAFWIFSLLSLLILPILTAIYSNTSGRHGAGLIRVAYVICDPVLACISITPVLILNHLPDIVTSYSCMTKSETWNMTCSCIRNHTGQTQLESCGSELHTGSKDRLANDIQFRFMIVQISVAIPVLISLLMCRRTSKMSFNTYMLTFAYWFVITIESVDLLEAIRLGDIYRDVIYTTMSIIVISIIITNSYAVVTLCSFISPQAGNGRKQTCEQFDFIYKVLVGCSGVLFMETPLLVARFQILTSDLSRILPAAFYLWFIKDFLFILLIVAIVFTQKISKKHIAKLPCRVNFDNPDVVFKPEKRDEYIERKKRVRFRDPPATTFGEGVDEKYDKNNGEQLNIKLNQTSTSDNTFSRSSAVNNNSNPTLSKQCSKRVPEVLVCFPLTDQPASSVLTSSTGILKGARPKVHNSSIQQGLLLQKRSQSDVDTSSESSTEAVM